MCGFLMIFNHVVAQWSVKASFDAPIILSKNSIEQPYLLPI